MNQSPIYITQADAKKLRDLIWEAEHSSYRGSAYLQKLIGELERANIVAPQDVPGDVITMNSTATLLDTQTGERMDFTLVYPNQADVRQGKISVLAPVGTAMLGYRVGDIFEWDTPGGQRVLRVEKIIAQPEASGDYA